MCHLLSAGGKILATPDAIVSPRGFANERKSKV
jgi:hypothetical protein